MIGVRYALRNGGVSHWRPPPDGWEMDGHASWPSTAVGPDSIAPRTLPTDPLIATPPDEQPRPECNVLRKLRETTEHSTCMVPSAFQARGMPKKPRSQSRTPVLYRHKACPRGIPQVASQASHFRASTRFENHAKRPSDDSPWSWTIALDAHIVPTLISRRTRRAAGAAEVGICIQCRDELRWCSGHSAKATA